MLCYRCGSYTPDGSRKCAVCNEPLSPEKRRATVSAVGGLTTGVTRPPLKPGTLIADRYRITAGGESGVSGWVLRAQDTQEDAEVALKLIHSNLVQTEAERGVFLKVIKRAERLQHPNLARVLAGGRDGTQLFYAMPYFEGLTLRKIIDLRLEKEQTFKLDEVLPLFGQLAVALDYLAKGGAHGALRPSNVIVLPDVLKVTGLAHLQGLPRRPYLMLLQERGEVEYLAPEVRSDDGKVTVAADIYSMAVIVAEMITGERHGRDAARWEEVSHQLPSRLCAVLQRALSDDVGERFTAASAFYTEIAAAAASRGVVVGASAAPPLAEGEPTVVEQKALGAVEGRVPVKPQPALMSDPGMEPLIPRDALEREGQREEPVLLVAEAPQRVRTLRVRRRIGGGASSRVLYAAGLIVILGMAVSLGLWWHGRSRQPRLYAPPAAATPSTSAGRSQVVLQPRPLDPVEASVRAADASERRVRTRHERSGRSVMSARDLVQAQRRAARAALEAASADKDAGSRVEETAPRTIEPPVSVAPPAPPPAPSLPVGVPDEAIAETTAGVCPAGMVYVPGGAFLMGSATDDPMRGFAELPALRKHLDAFCIDRYEAPNVAGSVPTTAISWEAAERACDDAGRRLCTEAEWEYACKGRQGRAFPYGGEARAGVCNLGESAPKRAAGASRDCRSQFGVYDLAGNVAEWTASQFPGSMADKIVKGGAAGQPDFAGRCAARANSPARSRDSLTGYRCCADVD